MHGVLGPLKDGAFYLRDVPLGAEDWRSVEVRYVWCENSVWEMPFGYHLLSTELEEARKGGKKVRNVSFGLIRGANHFVSLSPDLVFDGCPNLYRRCIGITLTSSLLLFLETIAKSSDAAAERLGAMYVDVVHLLETYWVLGLGHGSVFLRYLYSLPTLED